MIVCMYRNIKIWEQSLKKQILLSFFAIISTLPASFFIFPIIFFLVEKMFMKLLNVCSCFRDSLALSPLSRQRVFVFLEAGWKIILLGRSVAVILLLLLLETTALSEAVLFSLLARQLLCVPGQLELLVLETSALGHGC